MCSHRDILENRNEMNGDEFKDVFKKLKLFPEYINLNQIYQIFGERAEHNGRQTLNVLEFIECFKQASQLVYHSNELASRILDHADDARDSLLVWIFDRFIQTEVHKFTLEDHAKLEKPAIKKLLEEFNPTLNFLFMNFANTYEEERLPFEEARHPILPFQQTFELFSLTGLFPHRCEKEALRFYFDYMSPTDEGLDFETFRMFMALMGTYIIKRAKKSKIHDKKVQVGSAGLDEGEETDHTNSRVTLNLNASENDLKLPSQLPEMLRVFFESKHFIGPLWTLKPKIQRNESILKVDDINTKKRFYNRNKFNKSLLNYIDSNIVA